MAKGQGMMGLRGRAAANVAPVAMGAGAVPVVRKRVSPMQFLREVRAEARKVTWTSWKETWITSIMVGIMVIVTAMFFFGVDAVLHAVVTFVLKLANAE
jgi:preprotein translocase subunit SecE